jgi:sigma-B regulation protein RsbU (phosphoserine phosphatase)
MENMRYRQDEITLIAGDELFLYTDGVTEAMNDEHALFTEARLLKAMNANGGTGLKDLLGSVKQSIDAFAGGAEQADDITMLSLRYRGGGPETTL